MRLVLFAPLLACANRGTPATVDGTSDAAIAIRCSMQSVSFHTDVTPLVDHCGSEMCHGGLGPSWSYAQLVNQPTHECTDQRVIVKPGDPANSYLIQKLTGTNLCSGVRMPKIGDPLPAAQLQTIVDWICEGAPNN